MEPETTSMVWVGFSWFQPGSRGGGGTVSGDVYFVELSESFSGPGKTWCFRLLKP